MGTITDFDKISIIDLIIEHYPELKKDRTNLIKLVLQQVTRPNKLILEKITHEDKTYYKYNDGILIDENLNTIGIVIDDKIIITDNIYLQDDIFILLKTDYNNSNIFDKIIIF